MIEPTMRFNRLRANETLRAMVQEHRLSRADLIQPIFIHHGEDIQNEIPSMPGQYQYSINHAVDYAKRLYDLGIQAVLLFGIPAQKDAEGSNTWDDKNGIIQQGLRQMRRALPDDMILITDVCFCEYTDHGHCGVLTERRGGKVLDQEATLNNLALQASSHARAGADMVAPSGMIDQGVGVIRESLDEAGFEQVAIMGYSAKYASSFYGPFREAAQGAPQFGDRHSTQLNIANSDEAMREIELDIQEGADIVMVKPALGYLDIVRRAKETFGHPTAVYNVSGEYAMVKAAAAKGWLDEKAVVLEILTAMKRAGADLIISYHSEDAARWM